MPRACFAASVRVSAKSCCYAAAYDVDAMMPLDATLRHAMFTFIFFDDVIAAAIRRH